jgi:O-antigen/teichoic acid export membrane protein
VLLLLPFLLVWAPRVFPAAAGAAFHNTLLLMALSLAILFPARCLGNYMSGIRRFDLFNVATISSVLLRNGLVAVLLLTNHGVVSLAAATLVSSVFLLLLAAFLIRRADPGLVFSARFASWSGARELFVYGGFAFVTLGGESLRSYTDALVIARTLTVALITPFNVATRLIEYAKGVLSAIASPLNGRMCEFVGRNDAAALRHLYLNATRYFTLIAAYFGMLFYFDGRALIHLWVGPEYASSYGLLLILVAGYLLAWAQYPSNLLLFSVARHRFLAALTLVEGLANLGLSFHWAHVYGLRGVAWGTTVPLLIASVAIEPWYVLRVAGIRWGEYFRLGFARATLTALACSALLSLGMVPVSSSSWAHLCAAGLGQSLLFAVCAGAVGVVPDERQAMLLSFRRILIRANRRFAAPAASSTGVTRSVTPGVTQ